MEPGFLGAVLKQLFPPTSSQKESHNWTGGPKRSQAEECLLISGAKATWALAFSFRGLEGEFMESLGGARIFGCSFESTSSPHNLPKGVPNLDRRTQEEPSRGALANLRGQGYLDSGTLFSRERLDGARIFGCSFESTVPPHNLPKGVPKLDRRTQEEPGRGVLAKNLKGAKTTLGTIFAGFLGQ